MSNSVKITIENFLDSERWQKFLEKARDDAEILEFAAQDICEVLEGAIWSVKVNG